MAEQTRAVLQWEGGLRFSATGERSGRTVVMDSPTREDRGGPSPMELLLMGVAGCTAMDVVAILEKMRQPLARFQVEIVGERAEQHPKYYTAITIVYRLWGDGLSREKVERAVQLSHETYCSALTSLRPDCRIASRIELQEP
jgi:putative redox protein